MNTYSTSLFIFRRDLRLYDNTALNEALRISNQVIACFIFDPRQIDNHPYQSKPGLQFMLESLRDLQKQFPGPGDQLILYHAPPEQVIQRLHLEQQIQAVFVNRDYTPFSRHRDNELYNQCTQLGIAFHYHADALLTEPEQAAKNNRTPYKQFTAFYNHARQIPVSPPNPLQKQTFKTLPSDVTIEQFELLDWKSNMNALRGGRSEALTIFNQLGTCNDYLDTRDFPALNATSKLSAHLKFGTCSIREIYYAIAEQLGHEHPLLRQLYWRDFFTHIAFHFPQVFGQAFLPKFNQLQWDNNSDYFQAWCAGLTGFPIVDAGMRELNSTGYMHNRVRMIVASFLVKDLHIHWRWGERYFAQHLVDYDPCINNGNWQWAASTGCDAQPFFRIFNPWRQQEKFDPDCEYIHLWLPELQKFSPKMLHQWYKTHTKGNYPAPIIDHGIESRLSMDRFKAVSNLVS
ncbi:MAG: deoxyribodipyrimidine photo-lyase [Methylococcaceae bacterium]|nr:deoxyribodipyrimidine photo-lyase [Methylococcaceae bacterium]